MEESSASGAELAARARVAPELVERLVELGILGPAPYGLGDVRRARLVAACERAGLPLEGTGAAIAEGRLALAFLDLVSIAGRALTGTTYAQLCAQEGLPMELVQRVHEASGLGVPGPSGGPATSRPPGAVPRWRPRGAPVSARPSACREPSGRSHGSGRGRPHQVRTRDRPLDGVDPAAQRPTPRLGSPAGRAS